MESNIIGTRRIRSERAHLVKFSKDRRRLVFTLYTPAVASLYYNKAFGAFVSTCNIYTYVVGLLLEKRPSSSLLVVLVLYH